MLKEAKQKFQWTDECEKSVKKLKEALTSSPFLAYPQPKKLFVLDTDASNESIGAVLSQEMDGNEYGIAYWSKCLSNPSEIILQPRKNCQQY